MYNAHRIDYLNEVDRILEDERKKRHHLAMLTLAIVQMGIADELAAQWEERFGKFDSEGE